MPCRLIQSVLSKLLLSPPGLVLHRRPEERVTAFLSSGGDPWQGERPVREGSDCSLGSGAMWFRAVMAPALPGLL